MSEWQFEWFWCDTCDCAAIQCPKCGNNCCNGMYGPAEGTVKDKNWDPGKQPKCPVCPLTYQYAQTRQSPTKEQLETL